MKKEQTEKENSSVQKKAEPSPVLYRILSQRDINKPLQKKVNQDIVSTEFFSEFITIKKALYLGFFNDFNECVN